MKRPTEEISIEQYRALHVKPEKQPAKPRPPSPAERLARKGWMPRCDVEHGVERFRYWHPATGRSTDSYDDEGQARREALEVLT
jgi:hypothetical protein